MRVFGGSLVGSGQVDKEEVKEGRLGHVRHMFERKSRVYLVSE